jgi:hypothetical protein
MALVVVFERGPDIYWTRKAVLPSLDTRSQKEGALMWIATATSIKERIKVQVKGVGTGINNQ